MAASSIASALLYGYTPRVILNRLARSFPQHASKIEGAIAAGYGADFILQNLIGGEKKNSRDPEDSLTDKEQIHKMGKDRKKRSLTALIGALGTAGALGAGAYAFLNRNNAVQPSQIIPAMRGQKGGNQGANIPVYPRGIPHRQGQLPGPQKQNQLPYQPPQNPNQNPPQGPQGINPKNLNSGPKNPPPSPIPMGPLMPQAPRALDPEKSIALVKNLKEDGLFNNILLNNNFDPLTATKAIRAMLPKSKVSLFEQAEGGLEKIVKDYDTFLKSSMQQQKQQEQQIPESPVPAQRNFEPAPKVSQESVTPQQIQQSAIESQTPAPHPNSAHGKQLQGQETEQISSEPLKSILRKEFKPLDVDFKNIVITPEGVGEVKHEGKKGVIAKVNGKDKSFYPDDIERPSEDVIKAVSDILQIPEVDRSSNIALFTYDPSDAEMYFQFHNGESYKYKGIDPEKVYRLANKMGIPITEGKNIFGAWSPEDKESLGAAFYQEILKDPKYAKNKKGEPENPNYRKLETMYDYWKDLRKKPKRKKQ